MGWPRQLAGLLVSIAALLIIYWSSVRDLVGLWSSSEAYRFLYLVLPISLFIIWSRRQRLKRIEPKLRFWALIPLIGFAGLWLASHAAFVAVGEHIALIGMLQSLLMLFLGGRVFWALLFPFMLMWMMVPVGDRIMPQLMALTTFLSKTGLTLLGTTTSTDGTILITDAGRYSIVEACSALPFIVGNLIITLVFANLNYRRFYKQALLVITSVPVAIFANIVRIVAVVLITEATDKGIDLVADHTTFGWIVFAVAVGVEILLAAQYAEKQTPMSVLAQQEPRFSKRQSRRRLVAASAIVAIALLAAPRAWTAYGLHQHQAGRGMENCSPTSLFVDRAAEPDWRPGYHAAPDYSDQGRIETPGGPVDIYVAYYRRQTKDREMVGWRNKPFDGKSWALNEVLPGPTDLARDMPPPDVARLRNAVKDRRIVWTWYWVDGRFTGDPLTAKLWQARAVLEAHNPQSAVLLLSVAENFDPASAEPKLRAALQTMDDPQILMEQAVRAACPAQALTQAQ